MKTRQFIILICILVLLGLMYIPVINTDTDVSEEEKAKESNYIPVVFAINKVKKQIISSYGQIIGNAQIDVSMEVQGEIDRENRSLKTGTTFKKNEILIKVDRIEALYNLLSQRSSFINLISGILPDIYMDFPEESEKWDKYLSRISATSALPDLPKVNSQKEKLLINGRNIPSEYYSIKSAETQLEKYYYVAPFSGEIIESFVEPGSMVAAGSRLLTIAKTDDYEVKAPISITDLALYKSAEEIYFTGARSDTLGVGHLKRVSGAINQQTQSVDAYFTIKPFNQNRIMIGSFVNLSVETPLFEESVTLPENAVYNNTVQLLRDSLIVEKKVVILGNKPDSLHVKGVPDSSYTVVEPYKYPSDSTRFIKILK
ncbi:MAG: efflux RND transporter periplasmic adaptor subunit [Brumimicrobium sp.]